MTQATESRFRGSRFLMVSAYLVIVVAGLRAVKPIALPFAIAIFLAVLSAPLLSWLLRHRVPKLICVVATVLANVAVVAAMLLLVGGSLKAFSDSLPAYQQRIEKRTRLASDWLERKGIETAELDWLLRGPEDAQEPRPGSDLPGAPTGDVDLSDRPPAAGAAEPPPLLERTGSRKTNRQIELGDFFGIVSATLRSVAGLMTMTFLIFLLLAFILAEAAGLPNKLRVALKWQDADLSRMDQVKQEIQRYLGIKTLISLTTGIAVGVWVWMMQVDFPQLWGLVAFLLNYIPNIGSFIASLPAIFLALIQFGPGRAAAVAAGYIVINVALGNFLEPHLLGRKLGISPLVLILSLVFWGWVWGPIGMLLSVPLTMVLRIVLEHTEDLRWIAQLIAANPRPNRQVAA